MKKLSRLSKVSLLLALFFAVDKGLGILRIMLVSRQFQLSGVLDAFNSANNIPDMLFMLISGGALAIAFIPVLSEVLTAEGREKAWKLFSNILNIALIVTVAAAILVAIFARTLVSSKIGVAPGFTPDQIDLTTNLMRLNLVATIIFSISGLVMSGLQTNQHFFLPALAPIFYDIGQIFGVVILAPTTPYQFGPVKLPAMGLGVNGMVYGVIIGALLHLLIQIPGLLRFKFKWTPVLKLSDAATKRVLKLMGPRVLSMFFIAMIFNIQDNLASRLSEGSVTALTYGWWLMQIPETLIGTAIATAVLPTLSELFASKQFDALATKIEKAGRIMLALTVPIAVVASVVLSPLVERFFGFSAADTQRVVDVSRVFMAGIIGHSLVELFVRSFYSVQKPFFPTFGAGLTMLVFLGLGVVLYQPFQAVGIAAANTIAYAIQAGFLFIFLRKEFQKPIIVWPTLLRGLAGALLGGAIAFGILYFRTGFLYAIVAFLIGIIAAALLVRVDLKELNSL
ncbi:MAG TPA: murein biosynthesis integral membrane protein MurJ [Anaerolineaceae bacterium]|nr:murein biosynthesis integral membrane protein MurJ [Anaerolineaceae bacterium]